MYTHGLNTAMTLYRNGTLTLSQAASRAGRSTDAFATALVRHGIPVRERQGRASAIENSVGAD
ncbi:DUF7317 family protein [Halobellus rufus]|uniref:DUF7317 family protein n=1 Tax=Halobellus rufus TaxID=1448860 RepID=UPI0006798A47|nr:UPF0175 family protein [Halobellus rufus]